MPLGAHYLGNGQCEFVVWAPLIQKVSLYLVAPTERLIPMERQEKGYWRVVVDDVSPETLYWYRLAEERDRPDPASHFQPRGVHGPSQVIDHRSFHWNDALWRNIDLSDLILYELHVGTFTPEGSFQAVIPRLPALQELGVNAIELMPVAQFPGERNWGYDGVYPFAVQNSYGGPTGLKQLVNACHQQGIAVVLDVVYNHLGPEGNYLWDFAPYFTDRYRTPWGQAINFDGPYSDEVRRFFITNALFWFQHYHIDALRLDAIHAIYDHSAVPFLQDLAQQVESFVRKTGQRVYLIAESDLNNARVIRPKELGGYGMHAQWCDDFHHALHTVLTGEDQGYYQDFGRIEHLIKSLREGFVYSGQYSVYRQRQHGNSAADRPADQFVVFIQNHDQIGNRMLGERLSQLLSFESLKLAAGVMLLSPYIPLLFMGEEYGEEAPFLYFVSHSDPGLIEAIREGRKEEFRAFTWRGETPDPQSVETFRQSKLHWEKQAEGAHKVLRNFYQTLIRLRKEIPALAHLQKDHLEVWGAEEKKVLWMRRWMENSHIFALFNFQNTDLRLDISLPGGQWRKIMDSADSIWNGPGGLLPEQIQAGQGLTIHGRSFAVYKQVER